MGSVSYCIIENWWTESKFWICFFSVKWIKTWIIFHFSFSILLAQCINGISFCSVTNLMHFFSCFLVRNQRLRSYSNMWLNFMSVFNPIYSLWAFFVPNEKQKIYQRMRYKSDLTCHNRTTRTSRYVHAAELIALHALIAG